MSSTVEPALEVRPFHVDIPEEELCRPSPPDRGVALARQGDRRRSLAGRAARDDSGTRPLLGDRLRLAQVRGETERPTAVHDGDRWARHSFYSRSFET